MSTVGFGVKLKRFLCWHKYEIATFRGSHYIYHATVCKKCKKIKY